MTCIWRLCKIGCPTESTESAGVCGKFGITQSLGSGRPCMEVAIGDRSELLRKKLLSQPTICKNTCRVLWHEEHHACVNGGIKKQDLVLHVGDVQTLLPINVQPHTPMQNNLFGKLIAQIALSFSQQCQGLQNVSSARQTREYAILVTQSLPC